ncbi:caspase family protein [Streptomyces mirabilis]|uniref:VMAP-C domain-containing protein n=1 Tax=Streptomyces mirabilis TaxID=68239 RepID=UPI003717AFE3
MSTADVMEPIDPRRMFALVVGIESYAISHRWDLPGAARDAVRFADWLTAGGVPEEQVHVLVSPLDRTAAGLPDSDGPAPTRDHVERLLFKELPACDGDLLWIYWAGHGYLDHAHQLLLPYADATRDWTSHLNLEAALRWWKGSGPMAARFRRQIAIGDACRVDARLARKLSFGVAEYGARPPDPDRLQFTLYASRVGELAQNLPDSGAGQFTDALIRRLRETSPQTSVRELVPIVRTVQADLLEMRSRGLAWQQPQFVVDRDWTGSTFLGDSRHTDDRPTGGTPTHGAACLDQRAWDELAPLLHLPRLPSHTYDAYRWAFEITDCARPARRGLPTAELAGITHDLDARQGRRGMPLVLPFMRYLAAHCTDSVWAQQVLAWIESARTRLGMSPVPVPPRADPEQVGLHVRFEEDTERDGAYWVRMWLYRNEGFETLWESDQPLDPAGTRRALARLLDDTYACDVRRIEFHVPLGLLAEPFESWRLPIGRRHKPVELGQTFEVVVRCPQERDGLAGALWLRKWQWLKAHGGTDPQAVRELRDEGVSVELGTILQAAESPVCVLADVSGPRLTETIEAVLDAGVPIAVWHRDGGEPGRIAAILAEQWDPEELNVRRLPFLVWQSRIPNTASTARTGRTSAARLALMWDDPERVPERRALS